MATKRKANPKKRGRKKGQLSKYKPDYCAIAKELCWMGATDKQLAERFGVAEPTIRLWQKEHPDFAAVLNETREIADARVVNSLYRRAMGYEHEAVKILQYEGAPVIVPYTERYPPDPTSMIFWLKNRRRDQWRDKQDVEHSGSVTLEQLVADSGLPK